MTLLRLVAIGLALILAFGAAATALLSWRMAGRFPPQGRFVDVEGGRLHYLEAGPPDGRALGTVVLLHGASANAADPMLRLGARLSQRFRVIAFDRPGQGWSDRIGGAEAGQPARQAALIAGALRRMGVARAVIVGHSLAGAIVPNLALDHPDVTGGILILSGVTHPWPGKSISWYYHPATSVLGWIFTRTLSTPLGALLVEPAVRAVFAPEAAPPDYVERTGALLVLRPSAFKANAEDVAGLHAAVAAQSPRYPQIRVPATVMGGDKDRIVWTDLHARSFAREVPGAKLVVMPGVGHMPHQTQPEAVAAEVEDLADRAWGRAAAAAE
jgi:pimeloyl-ACP methyl ester carboxylesterase